MAECCSPGGGVIDSYISCARCAPRGGQGYSRAQTPPSQGGKRVLSDILVVPSQLFRDRTTCSRNFEIDPCVFLCILDSLLHL